jgi:ABC-type multidrug transport system fused ATPase/permease subunit
MTALCKLVDLLTPKERVQAQLLLGMILIMALLDAIGVASIMPFMAVVTNPGLIETNALLSTLYKVMGSPSQRDFLLVFGILVFIFLLFSLIFKALTTYCQLRFNLLREYSIGKRLVEAYLHQPYSWFLSRNSAELGKNILSEVNTVITNGMIPFTTLIAQSAVACALLLLLLIVDPLLAICIGVVVCGAYSLIFKFISGALNRLGLNSLEANSKRFMVVSESFSAAKEVKIGGLETTYINRFADSAEIYAKHQSTNLAIVSLPRFALEAIAFGGMMLMALYLMVKGASLSDALPVISLYAFAGYRLVPAFQQIFGSLSQLRITGPAINALHADLSTLKCSPIRDTPNTPISLKQSITLNDIHYAYPNAARLTLNGISLNIPAHKVIGLVGSTGCGKTTTVDLILGLLESQQGTLCVDGQEINSTNIRQWQKMIGYVPQQIYLADDTVASNIAFGVDKKDINQDAVTRAAKIANLHDFLMHDLPDGYETKVGERGVRLSGGQRQRIGIARALYHNPQVLILDEATSALDNLTELAVMEAINKLRHDITIILIAHRLSTVKECDQIYLLDKGQVIAQGDYDYLRQSSTVFQEIAMVFQ